MKNFVLIFCSNKPDYVPKPIHLSELDLVFDTSYTDIQPYLFKVKIYSDFILNIFFLFILDSF